MSARIDQILDVVTPTNAAPPSAHILRARLSRRRRRRRMASATAVVLALIAAATVTRLTFAGDSSPTRIESVVVPDTEQSLTLTFTELAVAGPSPGQLVSDGRRFYVIEDTPGEPTGYRRSTGYTFSGTAWRAVDFGDRHITSDIRADDGLLYVLSYSEGVLPELGTSSDGGVTWQWHRLDSDFIPPAFSSSYEWASVASVDGVQLVTFSRWTGPPYEEARALVRGALGIDIDNLGNEASGGFVTLEGIELHRVPDSALVLSACDEALREASGQVDYAEDLGLTSGTVGELFIEAAAVEGCQERAECAATDAARQIDWRALNQALEEADVPYAARQPLFEEGRSACAAEVDDIGGSQYDDSQASTEFISWEEIGVTVPDHWQAAVFGVRVEGTEVTDLGPLFPLGNSHVVGVAADDDGFQIATSQQRWADDVVADDAALESSVNVWKAGPDLDDWTESEEMGPGVVDWIASEPFEQRSIIGPDHARYDIRYTARGGPVETDVTGDLDVDAVVGLLDSAVVRIEPSGTTMTWSLDLIVPDLDGAYLLTEIAVGPLGIAAVAEAVGGDASAPPVLLVSSDGGESWLADTIDAGFVHQLAVGADAVMIETSNSSNRRDGDLSMTIASIG